MEDTVEESRTCHLLEVLLDYNYKFDPKDYFDPNVSSDSRDQFLADIQEVDHRITQETVAYEVTCIKDKYEEVKKRIGEEDYVPQWYRSAQSLFEEQKPSENAKPEMEMECPEANVEDKKMTEEISSFRPQFNFPTSSFDGPSSSINLNTEMPSFTNNLTPENMEPPSLNLLEAVIAKALSSRPNEQNNKM